MNIETIAIANSSLSAKKGNSFTKFDFMISQNLSYIRYSLIPINLKVFLKYNYDKIILRKIFHYY